MFEEQMGSGNFEMFFGNFGARAAPKTCDRVIEGRTIQLGCKHQKSVVQKVLFASYGTPGTCTERPLLEGHCHSATSRQVVEAACLGKNRCSVKAVNDVFEEPCYGTTKYLTVDVLCTPPPPAPRCSVVQEGKTVELGCGADAGEADVIVEVLFANYGKSTGKCEGDMAAGRGFVVNGCGSGRSRQVVEESCLQQRSCSISADNKDFGDPCYGTTKRLAVAVRCGATDQESKLDEL
eukprot:SAG31_NODE_4888_length_2884_cov_1.624776_2_plen_236_part_00